MRSPISCPLESFKVELFWWFTESEIDTISESSMKKKPANTNVQAIDLTCFRTHKCLFPTWAPLQELKFPESFFNPWRNATLEFEVYSPPDVILPGEGSLPDKVSENLTWWFFIPEDNLAPWNSGCGFIEGHCFT